MNNLILSATVITTAGLLLLGEARYRADLEWKNQIGRRELRTLEAQGESLDAVIAEARSRLGRQREDLAGAKVALQIAPASSSTPPPLDPGREGLWPQGKAYCYVEKKVLRDALFQRFQGAPKGMALHPDTALALGLTPEEAVAVDQGFQALVNQYQVLELQRLEPTSAHLENRWRGTKISYRIPPLREEMETPLHNYFGGLRQILGEGRGELLEYWAREAITDSLGNFGPKARIITFTEEPMRGEHQLTRFQIAEEGGKELYYYELWNKSPEIGAVYALPAEFMPRFPYRHLFGDNGERRRNPKP